MSLDRKFTENPAYNPKECGLEQVAYIEWGEQSYSFDETYVWRDLATGLLYFASDSGCSCPSPFEDYHTLSSLERLVSMDQVDALLAAHKDNYNRPDVTEADGFRADVKKALAKHKRVK
jgi:hypothetical protein